jgi:alpha-beta hydrolase superfamily lysophospholipase
MTPQSSQNGFLRRAKKVLRILALSIAVFLVTVIGVRLYNVRQSPPLAPWHTYVPDEFDAQALDHSTWDDYLRRENEIFAQVTRNVTDKLTPDEQVDSNRYFSGAPVNPGHFQRDWNRSYILEPEGEPVGVAVMLHGLTDSPYSLRHIASRYREEGFVVVSIRLPGHGTVPGGLTRATWQDWVAATRLAVREARRRVPAPRPLHLVGFSNGGALAVMHAMNALDDPKIGVPDRLILISPMIGITQFARFAGLAGLPAMLPSFAKAAWLSVVPEFNPFKYNSFPVHAARESFALSQELQRQIARRQREGGLDRLPPILTFHSVLDFTVSTRAVINALYGRLPANGSELVLFDLNRATKLGPLLRRSVEWSMSGTMPGQRRNYRLTIVTNASPLSNDMVARVTEAGSTTITERPLGMAYPRDIYSLSHVALPFPVNDDLYGMHPDNIDEYGISLGAISIRGEVGALIGGMDSFARLTSNPFYPYLIQRIDGVISRHGQPQDPP